jgi:hypothetical protein
MGFLKFLKCDFQEDLKPEEELSQEAKLQYQGSNKYEIIMEGIYRHIIFTSHSDMNRLLEVARIVLFGMIKYYPKTNYRKQITFLDNIMRILENV